MRKELRDYLAIQVKLATIEYAASWGNVSRACRTFRVPRSSYYRWIKIYEAEGEDGLKRKRPIAKNHPNRISDSVIE